MDWLKVLDVGRAVSNVRTDTYGDWYRDPWGWPEYDYVEGHPDVVGRRLSGRGVKRVARVDVAKENYSTRPAVVMDPVDRIAYQALVDLKSTSLIGNLSGFAYGWRLPVRMREWGQYARNDNEWDRYLSDLFVLVSHYDIGWKTDIVSCFASMPIERVAEEVARRAGGGKATDRLIEMLHLWNEIPKRGGLLQRSSASAVIANMYLDRIDRVLAEYTERKTTTLMRRHRVSLVTRWMDDIWVMGHDAASLRWMQIDLQDALRDAGLEMNQAKTAVYEGADLETAALDIQHSAIDHALRRDEPELQPLEELVDEITTNPETHDRTSIRFALTRLRGANLDTRNRALVEVAPRMPHGADHLARYFRDSAAWSDLQEWFVEYQGGSWARIEWAVAQLGTMFPTKPRNRKGRPGLAPSLRDCFLERMHSRPSLPMLALTAQRLASWSPDECRDAIRMLLEIADHPLERRLLGLTALTLKEEKKVINSILSEYDENLVTLEMVKERNYEPIPVEPDFGANRA